MKLKKIVLTFIVAAVAGVVLINSNAVRDSVAASIDACLNSVVPSLMTFMTVATFIAESDCADVLAKAFGRPIRLLFNLPDNCAKAVILSMLGGYPCGAKIISDMLKNGETDLKTAQRMLRFCINASPAYIVSAIGVGLFKNAQIGGIICISHLLSSVAIGVTFRGKKIEEKPCIKQIRPKFSECFVRSVFDSTTAMLYISGFTITFSTLLTLLDETGITQIVIEVLKPLVRNAETSRSIFYLLFDVVAGSHSCIDCPPLTALLLCAFAVSLGGMSIWAQAAFYLSGYKINLFDLIFFRFLHAVLTAGATYIIINITDTDISTAYIFATNTAYTPTGFLSTVLFLLCGALFVITADKNISLLFRRKRL